MNRLRLWANIGVALEPPENFDFTVVFMHGEDMMYACNISCPIPAFLTYENIDEANGFTLPYLATVMEHNETFAGWSLTPDGPIISLPMSVTSDITLYAVITSQVE